MDYDPYQVSGWRRTLLTVIAVAIAILFLLPTLWMLISSIRPEAEVLRFTSPLQYHTMIPTTLTVDNYSDLLGGPFARSVLNSLLLAGGTVVVGLLITSLAAFALAAMELPGRNLVFAVVVISFLVPFDAIAVPLARTFRAWGLTDSYLGLMLPALANGLAIFLLRQFFLGIPGALRDAALVDGASWWTIYRRIYVPMSRPAMIGAGLLLFLGSWQAYLWPLLVVTDFDLMVGPVALSRLFAQYTLQWGQIFAGSVILSLIPFVVLFAFRKQFGQTVGGGAVKE